MTVSVKTVSTMQSICHTLPTTFVISNTVIRPTVKTREHIIHLLHAGEGNMKMYLPNSIIFPEGNAQGEYDT